jgi:hypothetical protein
MTALDPSMVTDKPYVWAFCPARKKRSSNSGGKWLVFVPSAEVDSWWSKVRSAVEAGQLGPVAKVSTAYDNALSVSAKLRVVCAYTADWEDEADVRRVLAGLRELGVNWRLTYKTNEATRAGRYGPGSAMYVSQAGSMTFEGDHPASEQ